MLTSSAAIFLSFRERESLEDDENFFCETNNRREEKTVIERIVRTVVMIIHEYLFIYELASI